MLVGLLDRGIEVDLYCGGTPAQLPLALQGRDGLRVFAYDNGWRWGRWYSRHSAAAFLSGHPARIWTHTRLSVDLFREHRRRAYDCIFQLSQPELLLLGLLGSRLPPTVVHPCSHAAGELRWHRRESRYAVAFEPMWIHVIMRAILILRSRSQRRSFRKPDLVVGPSDRFLELVAEDYRLSTERLRVLRHPVHMNGQTANRSEPPANRPLELLFVSRISCRKGVELIVGLSHRLRDLQGQVHITIVGGHTMWSDYRGALKALESSVATYAGSRPFLDVLTMYETADALLVPSRYEPGSLVVCEALAGGVPVVASDEVGPSEVVDALCMRRFPAGDLDAFEHEVRELLPELRANFTAISERARSEAERHFAPDVISRELEAILREAAALPQGA